MIEETEVVQMVETLSTSTHSLFILETTGWMELLLMAVTHACQKCYAQCSKLGMPVYV